MVDVNLTKAVGQKSTAIAEIERESGVCVTDCYQCGKCTASCPVAHAMDLVPRQVLRYLQLGMWDEVLHAHSPWLCAACTTCYDRCPQQVDIPSLMEAIRQQAKQQGICPEKDLDKFNNLFLNNIKMFGKSHEMVLSGLYNLTSGHLLQDVPSAPHMYFKKMIRIRPHTVKDKAAVRRLVAKCLENRGGK